MNKLNQYIEEFNVNPKSKLIHCFYPEIIKISSQIFKGLNPMALSITMEFMHLGLFEDSIIFSYSPIRKSKQFHKRMFWEDVNKYEFVIKVKKLAFGRSQVIINYKIDDKKFKHILTVHKTKDTRSKISEKTLSFIKEKISI